MVCCTEKGKMIYVILATVVANIIYKAKQYGRGDVADIIILIAAISIALL
jgi:hypothetical protein